VDGGGEVGAEVDDGVEDEIGFGIMQGVELLLFLD
jgi:hypothetical protein